MKSVKLENLAEDQKAVEDFIDFILSNMQNQISEQLKGLMEKGQLGFNKKTGRVGVLFPEHLADFRLSFGKA